jgi:hypothetical protein
MVIESMQGEEQYSIYNNEAAIVMMMLRTNVVGGTDRCVKQLATCTVGVSAATPG